MTTRQATCEERLPEHLEGRLDDMRSMVGWANAWSQTRNHLRGDAAQTRLDEYGLDLEIEKVYKVRLLLSTGGPADWFETTIDSRGHIGDVVYVFQDWFDGARKVLFNDERQTALDYIGRLIDLDSIDIYAGNE